MTTYESDIKTISSNEEVVFDVLSDLRNLEKLQQVNELSDKMKDAEFTTDSCSFNVEGLGKVGFRIIEREPNKTIKFESENIPFKINVWIQLKQIAEKDTKLKLTLKANIPTMVKMMVDKRLKEGINTVADVISKALSQN